MEFATGTLGIADVSMSPVKAGIYQIYMVYQVRPSQHKVLPTEVAETYIR